MSSARSHGIDTFSAVQVFDQDIDAPRENVLRRSPSVVRGLVISGYSKAGTDYRQIGSAREGVEPGTAGIHREDGMLRTEESFVVLQRGSEADTPWANGDVVGVCLLRSCSTFMTSAATA